MYMLSLFCNTTPLLHYAPPSLCHLPPLRTYTHSVA